MCDHCGCRQFPSIAELSEEHEQILAVAWELSEDRRSPGREDTEAGERLLRMLAVHVRTEEEALYPLLVGTGGLSPERCQALEDEHTEIEIAITRGAFDRRAYFELAAHIEEEELELFPAAMFGFEDEDWDVLDATERFVSRAVTAS